MKKKILALLLTAAMVLSLCACGTKKEASKKESSKEKLTDITMVLDWTPNTNHTGLYVAKEKGYFKDAGLNVSIIQPPDNGATDLVASGGAEFGVDFQDTLVAAFASDSPLPVTAVGAILQHNTSGLISLKKSGIDSPAKLEKHMYATWDSPIEQAILKNVMAADGGDFSKVNLVSTSVENIVASLNADIDCVWIYYGWDGIKCKQEGLDTNYLPFREMNKTFDYYSPVIIANNEFLKKERNISRRNKIFSKQECRRCGASRGFKFFKIRKTKRGHEANNSFNDHRKRCIQIIPRRSQNNSYKKHRTQKISLFIFNQLRQNKTRFNIFSSGGISFRCKGGGNAPHQRIGNPYHGMHPSPRSMQLFM